MFKRKMTVRQRVRQRVAIDSIVTSFYRVEPTDARGERTALLGMSRCSASPHANVRVWNPEQRRQTQRTLLIIRRRLGVFPWSDGVLSCTSLPTIARQYPGLVTGSLEVATSSLGACCHQHKASRARSGRGTLLPVVGVATKR